MGVAAAAPSIIRATALSTPFAMECERFHLPPPLPFPPLRGQIEKKLQVTPFFRCWAGLSRCLTVCLVVAGGGHSAGLPSGRCGELLQHNPPCRTRLRRLYPQGHLHPLCTALFEQRCDRAEPQVTSRITPVLLDPPSPVPGKNRNEKGGGVGRDAGGGAS